MYTIQINAGRVDVLTLFEIDDVKYDEWSELDGYDLAEIEEEFDDLIADDELLIFRGHEDPEYLKSIFTMTVEDEDGNEVWSTNDIASIDTIPAGEIDQQNVKPRLIRDLEVGDCESVFSLDIDEEFDPSKLALKEVPDSYCISDYGVYNIGVLYYDGMEMISDNEWEYDEETTYFTAYAE